MNKWVLLYCLLICLVSACGGQTNKQENGNKTVKKIEIMKDFFDVKLFEKKSQDGIEYNYSDADGNSIRDAGDNKEGYIRNIKYKKDPFFDGYREYDISGKLICSGKLFKGNPVGIWYYYDSTGTLRNEINEDIKYGKFGPPNIVDFLINAGLIERSGKGFEFVQNIVYQTSVITHINEVRKKYPDTPEKGQWSISYCKSLPNCDNVFIIDGQTGIVISHKDIHGQELIK